MQSAGWKTIGKFIFMTVSDARLENLDQVRSAYRPAQRRERHRQIDPDVASVEQSTVPQWTRVTADGKNAVLFSVYQQPGSNSVQIASDIKTKLAAYRAQLPAAVKIASWYDQSELVVQAASSVRDAVLIGIALSALVLLIFLRNLKVTLIGYHRYSVPRARCRRSCCCMSSWYEFTIS